MTRASPAFTGCDESTIVWAPPESSTKILAWPLPMKDPTYDASAANYIDAMDICEPDQNPVSAQATTICRNASEEYSVVQADSR